MKLYYVEQVEVYRIYEIDVDITDESYERRKELNQRTKIYDTKRKLINEQLIETKIRLKLSKKEEAINDFRLEQEMIDNPISEKTRPGYYKTAIY